MTEIEDEPAAGNTSATLKLLSAEVLQYRSYSARDFQKDQIDRGDISMEQNLHTLWALPDVYLIAGLAKTARTLATIAPTRVASMCILENSQPVSLGRIAAIHEPHHPIQPCLQESSSLQAEKTVYGGMEMVSNPSTVLALCP